MAGNRSTKSSGRIKKKARAIAKARPRPRVSAKPATRATKGGNKARSTRRPRRKASPAVVALSTTYTVTVDPVKGAPKLELPARRATSFEASRPAIGRVSFGRRATGRGLGRLIGQMLSRDPDVYSPDSYYLAMSRSGTLWLLFKSTPGVRWAEQASCPRHGISSRHAAHRLLRAAWSRLADDEGAGKFDVVAGGILEKEQIENLRDQLWQPAFERGDEAQIVAGIFV